MSGEVARETGARVVRRDDRLGLAVRRASLSARTLVTYARDHVLVRTPSKPDFHDGNCLDLVAPPAADELADWVGRSAEALGVLGVTRIQLRWEQPLAADAPLVTAGELSPGEELREAAERSELELDPLVVLLLDDLVEPPPAPGDIAPVAPPSATLGGAVDRRWHAATVLYRYFEGDDPDTWRAADQSFVGWSVEVQRELALGGRCQVWLAMRHGGPVARLHVVHDQQGLACVEDVVVHPVHRRHGIAAALTHRAVAAHLEVHPGSRVGIVAEPGSAGERVYRRLGFRPHAIVWTLLRTAA